LSPGLIYAVTSDTSEPVGLAFAAAAILALSSNKRVLAAAAMSGAVLCKEPLLAVPAGLLIWEVISWIRKPSNGSRWRGIVTTVAPLFGFVGWQVYVRIRFCEWGLFASKQSLRFARPFKGWIDAVRFQNQFGSGTFDRVNLGAATLPLILVIGALLVIGFVRSIRMRSLFAPIFT